GLGADVVALTAELDLSAATTAWYSKGGLVELEHVGASQVAWTPADGLGRPFDRSGRSLGAQVAKKLAGIAGDDRTAGLLEPLDTRRAAAAGPFPPPRLYRLIGGDPPPFDELRGRVAATPAHRLVL